jgi:hypothetical protein
MLTQIFSQSRPVRLVVAGDGPTLIVNRDLTNAVLYGGQDIASGNINTYAVIDPLGSITVDGTSDLWFIPNSGSPTLDVVQGASFWAPSPAQVATQINALGLAKDTTLQTTNVNTTGIAKDSSVNTINTTLGIPAQTGDVTGLTVNGIPPLRGTVQLGQASAQTLAASGTATLLNNVNINKPSFESVFKLNLPAASGTVPFAILGVGWQDAVTGLQVGFKQYALSSGNGPSNAITYYLSGPCRGNQLVLTLQNLDAAQTLTYSWLFNITSHAYAFDKLLQPSYAATGPNGFGSPAGNPSKGLLFASSPNIGANGNVIRLCAASNAKCKICVDDSGQLNSWAVTITDPASLYNAAASNEFYKFNGAAGSIFNGEIQMPNGPVLVTMFNTAATNAITLPTTITAMEY